MSLVKNLANNMPVDLKVLGMLIKGKTIRNEDDDLIVIIDRHSPLHQNTKLIKEPS